EEHSRSGRSVGSHLGAGSGRPAAIPLGGGCGELLRERGALGHRLSELSYRATICQRSTGRSSLGNELHEGTSLPDVPYHMFRGRPVHSNSTSWTALCCSRKWMSGHADALAQSSTDPIWQACANRQPSDCSLAGNPSDKSEEMCVFP